ncbi:MAG TPA: MBL fold metallo-hydrolase, partial [Candidatus Pullichristensenella stercoripullorum]|nr:MBL fold metallo-hydrolase [Candidatus Pullichristensenella stercoripullorum]
MKLKWYGHSCFALTYADGTAIVIDPFDASVGYPLCKARADAALCSHDHHDHNYVQSLQGEPRVIADSAPCTVGGVRIHGLDCFHDEVEGAKRGRNIIFILEGDGLRVAHLGDLGHMPTPEMYAALRGVDILLVPIGGTYTITTPEAAALIREVKPHTAIAMHFKTVLCTLPITDEGEFVR